MQTKTTHFRSWKSGKNWLYAASILTILVGGTAFSSAEKVSADEKSTPQTSMMTDNKPQSNSKASPTSSVTSAASMSSSTSSVTSAAPMSSSSTSSMTNSTNAIPTSSTVSAMPSSHMTSASSIASSVASSASTTPIATVKSEVATHIAATTTVSASKLANAVAPGPFTAGVNQVIPLEAFGGDGMLTRLLLTNAAKAAWSDNGTAKNTALSAVDGLGSGEYFYEVDLSGTNGATGQDLLNLLRTNGTKAYQATVKIYGTDKTKVIATKAITVNFTGLTDHIAATTTVSASKLANAVAPGPFTAGVNQIIPLEAFGGDGMLTRLLLTNAAKAAWSDNGTAKNTALSAVDGLGSGEYFYEVDLSGTNGATGQDLLNLLRTNGTKAYQATVKIYGTNANGMPDTSKIIAMKEIMIDLSNNKMSVIPPSSNESIAHKTSNMNNSTMTESTMSNTMPHSNQAANSMLPLSSTQKMAATMPVNQMLNTLPKTGDNEKSSIGLFFIGLFGIMTSAILFVVERSKKKENKSEIN